MEDDDLENPDLEVDNNGRDNLCYSLMPFTYLSLKKLQNLFLSLHYLIS